jgi:hypothetical protein
VRGGQARYPNPLGGTIRDPSRTTTGSGGSVSTDAALRKKAQAHGTSNEQNMRFRMIVLNLVTNNPSSHKEIMYISVKTASISSGYRKQYLRRLLRENRLDCIKIGQMWFISIESLSDYVRLSQSFNDLRYGPRELLIKFQKSL